MCRLDDMILHRQDSPMRLLADKASRVLPGWNARPFEADDLHRLCAEFQITVHERPLVTNGFYYRAGGRDFIAINSRLPCLRRLEVFLHELAHFLFHAPAGTTAVGFHHVGRRTRAEREADAFALCALMPRTQLTIRTRDEWLADGLTTEMISERLEIYARHGI